MLHIIGIYLYYHSVFYLYKYLLVAVDATKFINTILNTCSIYCYMYLLSDVKAGAHPHPRAARTGVVAKTIGADGSEPGRTCNISQPVRTSLFINKLWF